MSASSAPVAAFKAAAPSLDGTVPRPALLARLAAVPAAARWVVAPSGSGKSTVAAQHAAATGRPLAWYRLDARDDDPAFFYRHFNAALAAVGADAAALPPFGDDDREDESPFAARFWRAVHERLGAALIVLDDAHRLAAPQALARLAAAIAQCDGAPSLLFVAEEPPPPAFFDAIAARRLAVCNDLHFAFDADECATLAAGARLAPHVAGVLHALTGGHAVALVLACELLRGLGADDARTLRITEAIQDHLVGRMLERMEAPARALLLATCHAPQFTAPVAAALAGGEALASLAPLLDRGLLRRAVTGHDEPVYEAHALVRRGLQRQVERQDGGDAARAHAGRTAAVLAAHGFDDSAFELCVALRNFSEAASLLERRAELHARRGEAHLLTAALACLPEHEVDVRPWLAFRAGQALLGLDEEAARAWFERAYAAFEHAGERDGMRLAAASVVTVFGLEYGDLRTLDAWMDRYRRAGGDDRVPPGSLDEARLAVAMICAAFVRGGYPDGVDFAAVVARLRTLLDDAAAWGTADEPVAAARVLIDHERIFRDCERAQAMALDTRAVVERAHGNALLRGRWAISAAMAYYEDGRHEAAAAYFSEAQALADRSGSRRLAFELGMALADAAQKRQDLDDAARHLAALESIIAQCPAAQRAEYARLCTRTLLLQGRHAEGLRYADAALDAARAAGYSGAHERLFELERIYALAANNRFDAALAAVRDMTAGLAERQADAQHAVRDALEYLDGGRRDAAALERAFGIADALGFVNFFSRARPVIALLCSDALERGMHAEFARRVIAVHRLDPPADAGAAWPWPVRLRTLGGFELEIDGERYRPAHKTQDKPLELLKLLVTCQAMGRDSADRAWVAERLWPDAEEPNARKSLEMALSRLRRLLQRDEAVLLTEGRLSLSPRHVWTDIVPLLRALRHAGHTRDEHAAGRSTLHDTALADVAAVLQHYHGPFLPEEGDMPWLLAGRDAVAAQVRAALLIADGLLRDEAGADLLPALERAFAADPTSEDLARALMRRLAARGEHGEVLRVYRRLRQMLSIVLGVPPSRATEALRLELQAAVPVGGIAAHPALREQET